MAIILDTTCWYLFPEGKVLKLRHKMNTKCHKKKSHLGRYHVGNQHIKVSLNSTVLYSLALEQSAVFFYWTPYETDGLC